MGKIIYENSSSKLLANFSGGVIKLSQYLGGELVGEVLLYHEEAKELSDFINGLDEEE